MHAARIENSQRLQATHAVLERAGRAGVTTMELIVETGSVAPHSDVAELRANGIGVQCRADRTTQRGRRIYRYTLEKFLVPVGYQASLLEVAS